MAISDGKLLIMLELVRLLLLRNQQAGAVKRRIMTWVL